MRALPVAVTLMDQARAWKHDTDLGNRLSDPAVGLLGRDAVLPIIGLQNAGIGAVTLIGDHEYVGEERVARPYRTRRHCAGIRGARHRVMAWPAAGYGVVAASGLRGEEDEQAQ